MLSAAKQYEQEMKKQDKKVLTLIVGSGALEPKLKAQADELELENTHFVGRHPHSVIRKLQNLADVSLIPSRDEPFGLVVIEGTSCGHPVIASNSGGIPGILNTKKETLPNQDIIQTELGVLIKPLPVRPESLSEEQKDELDLATTKFIIGTDDQKDSIVTDCSNKFGLSKETLTNYFEEYSQSTKALSDAVVKTLTGELTFDNARIATYTAENYAQPVIREKLINLFQEAENDFKKNSLTLD